VVVMGKAVFAPAGTVLGIIGGILNGIGMVKTIHNQVKLVRAYNKNMSQRAAAKAAEKEPLLAPESRADSTYIYRNLREDAAVSNDGEYHPPVSAPRKIPPAGKFTAYTHTTKQHIPDQSEHLRHSY